MAFVPSSVASSGKPQDLYFALKEDIPAAQVLSQNGNTISLSGGGGGVNVAATTAVSTSTQKLTAVTYQPGFLSTKFDGQVVVDGGLSGTSRLTGGTVEITRDTVNPAIVMSRQDIVGEGRIEYDGTKLLMGPVGISGEIYDSFGSPGAAGQQLQSSGPGLPFVWGAGSGIGLTAVVAGSNIGVDNTNPIAPVVNLAVTSTIDMSGNDLSGANAITAQNGFFTQTLNANSIKSTTDVQTATVTATGLVSGLSLAASNLQLQYNDASGGLVTVPAGKALSLTSGTTNAFHINSAGNVGIRMINTGATNVEVAGSLSATGQVRGVGASFSGETFTQAVTPNFNNTYDSGRPTSRWATVNTVNLSATGTVSAASLSTTGAVNFGTASLANLTYDAVNGTRLTTPNTTALTLRTGTTDALRITATGQVGINVTPAAGNAFEVNGASRMVGTIVSNTILPNLNNGFACGSTALRWSAVNTVNLDATGTVNAASITTTGTINSSGDITVLKASNPTIMVNTGSANGVMFWNTSANKLVLNNTGNAYPIRLEGSRVETLGNIQCGGGVNATGEIITNNGLTVENSANAPFIRVKSGTDGIGAMFWASNKLVFNTNFNAYPIRLEGSRVETAGNIECEGNITARAFYTTTVLTGTVSQNNSGALLVPNETGAYHFSAYLTSAPGTANIAGMIFVVNGAVTRVSTQFATLMSASAPNLGTSLLIQNLSSTSSPIRISVQRFGL